MNFFGMCMNLCIKSIYLLRAACEKKCMISLTYKTGCQQMRILSKGGFPKLMTKMCWMQTQAKKETLSLISPG